MGADAMESAEDAEDHDCPVCFEDMRLLPDVPVTMPCCHKRFCRPCVIALVGAGKGDATNGGQGPAKPKNLLVCPTCRAEHYVPSGNGEQWACKLALDDDASKWGGLDSLTAARLERDAALDPALCLALTREELIAAYAAVDSVHHATARALLGEFDRPRLIGEVARRLNSASGAELRVSELTVRAARAVLQLRDIPYGDCLEKAELCTRVEQSHRGGVKKLPIKVLKHMLALEGLGHEVYVDKENLARRVMAVRALRRPHATWYTDRRVPRESTNEVSAPAESARTAPPSGRSTGTAAASGQPPSPTPAPEPSATARQPSADSVARHGPAPRTRAADVDRVSPQRAAERGPDAAEVGGGGCHCIIS